MAWVSPARTGSRWRRLLQCLGVVLALLGSIELAFRALGVGALDAPGRQLLLRVSSDPDLAYELKPGASGHAWGCDVVINSHGFREREFAATKPQGTYRILVLGDSLTLGHRVPAQATYPRRLEALSAARGVEVLNLGVGGYDLIDEAVLLAGRASSFQPDLVLIGFCSNDVGVHSVYLRHLEGASDRPSLLDRLHVVRYVRERLDRLESAQAMEESNREDVFRARYAGRIEDVSDDANLVSLMSDLREWLDERPALDPEHDLLREYVCEAHVGRLRNGFEWLVRMATEHGFEIALVNLPYLPRAKHRQAYRLVDRIIEHEAARAGLALLSLQHTFKGITPGKLRSSRYDHLHFDERGHELVAQELARQLAKRRSWPPDAR